MSVLDRILGDIQKFEKDYAGAFYALGGFKDFLKKNEDNISYLRTNIRRIGDLYIKKDGDKYVIEEGVPVFLDDLAKEEYNKEIGVLINMKIEIK